jgi:hypothetical protein
MRTQFTPKRASVAAQNAASSFSGKWIEFFGEVDRAAREIADVHAPQAGRRPGRSRDVAIPHLQVSVLSRRRIQQRGSIDRGGARGPVIDGEWLERSLLGEGRGRQQDRSQISIFSSETRFERLESVAPSRAIDPYLDM